MVISTPSIYSKALEHAGNAFQYECMFDYSVEYYPVLLKGWRRKLTSSSDDIRTRKCMDKYIAALPKGVAVSSQREIVDDGRTVSSRDRGIAFVKEREILTIRVPKQVAWDLYFNRYAKIGYPFRDYLLSNCIDKLRQIIARLPANVLQHFYISVSGISNDNTAECRSFAMPFSFVEMGELDNVSQCYGLALALIEVMGKHRDVVLITEELGYIKVCPKPAAPAILEKW